MMKLEYWDKCNLEVREKETNNTCTASTLRSPIPLSEWFQNIPVKPEFFSGLLFQLLKLNTFNCEDHIHHIVSFHFSWPVWRP